MDIHCEDGDYTCDTCLFQCNNIRLLKQHLTNSPGHSSGQVRGRAAQKCNICDEKFLTKKDLMSHVNREHPSFKPCRDYKKGNCKRTICRYKHRIIKEGNCVCFQCGKDFDDTTLMMSHIKSNHRSSVCKKFLKNECDREEGTDDECWFRHERSAHNSSANNELFKIPQNPQPKRFQNFQKVHQNLAPPDPVQNQESLEKAMEQRILSSVSKMMASFMEQMKKNV